MRSHVPVLCAALSATASGALIAAPAAPPIAPTTAAPTQSVLAKRTPIRVRLETDLRSGRDKVGEPVIFTVAQNVYGPNHTLLLEKGALARGRVTESAGHGSLGRSGKLVFTCDYARADDGTRVPLNLVVTPSSGGDGSTGEIAAAVSTGARGYDSPGGYYSGYPGGLYQQAGTAVGVSADLGRVFGDGADVRADRGQQFEATVGADTPLGPAPLAAAPSQQLFTLKDKTQIVGVLAGFDGQSYTLTTPTGRRSIKSSEVQAIQAISVLP